MPKEWCPPQWPEPHNINYHGSSPKRCPQSKLVKTIAQWRLLSGDSSLCQVNSVKLDRSHQNSESTTEENLSVKQIPEPMKLGCVSKGCHKPPRRYSKNMESECGHKDLCILLGWDVLWDNPAPSALNVNQPWIHVLNMGRFLYQVTDSVKSL